jgi:hypothetical protein
MKCRIFVIVTALFLSFSGAGRSAVAADFDWMKKEEPAATTVTERKFNNQYVLFRAGGFFPAKFNVGDAAEAGYGIQPLKFLAAEASFGFIGADNYDDDTENEHTTVQIVPVTGTIRAILPLNPFDIYALAGGGMYYTMVKVDNKNKSKTSVDGDNLLLGYHYGGGVSLLLGGSSSLGLEVRQIVTNWDNLDTSGTFISAFFRMGL